VLIIWSSLNSYLYLKPARKLDSMTSKNPLQLKLLYDSVKWRNMPNISLLNSGKFSRDVCGIHCLDTFHCQKVLFWSLETSDKFLGMLITLLFPLGTQPSIQIVPLITSEEKKLCGVKVWKGRCETKQHSLFSKQWLGSSGK